MIDRRTLLSASAVSLLAGAVRAAETPPRDADLKAVLDQALAGLPPNPRPDGDKAVAAAIEVVKGFDPAGLSAARRRERDAVLQGLSLELAYGRSYAAALSFQVGAAVDPLVAHRQALAEAKRLQARAGGLLDAQGVVGASVGERLTRLIADQRYLYSDDDAGRDRAVADMNLWQTGIRPRLAQAFGGLAIPPAEARRMSAADEAKGRAGYREAGTVSRPGVYYVDLKAIRTRPSWTLPSVVHHELIPGHLLQLPYQAAAEPHPLRLRVSRAWFEAWGIYAEQLADDLGLMADAPLAQIGALHWRLFRLARIVADTGLGALHWSREQAVDAMRRIQGPPIAFVDIPADVDRMAREPAVFAAQGLGALEFARRRPPNGWSAYHRSMIDNGPWPFAELRGLA